MTFSAKEVFKEISKTACEKIAEIRVCTTVSAALSFNSGKTESVVVLALNEQTEGEK